MANNFNLILTIPPPLMYNHSLPACQPLSSTTTIPIFKGTCLHNHTMQDLDINVIVSHTHPPKAKPPSHSNYSTLEIFKATPPKSNFCLTGVTCTICKQTLASTAIDKHYVDHRLGLTTKASTPLHPFRLHTDINLKRNQGYEEESVKGWEKSWKTQESKRRYAYTEREPTLKTTECELDQLIENIKLENIRPILMTELHHADTSGEQVQRTDSGGMEKTRKGMKESPTNEPLCYKLERSNSKDRRSQDSVLYSESSERSVSSRAFQSVSGTTSRPRKLSLSKDIQDQIIKLRFSTPSWLLKTYNFQRTSTHRRPTSSTKSRLPINILAQQEMLSIHQRHPIM